MPIEAVGGVCTYLILCAVSLLVGNGLIQLLQLSVPDRTRLFLAPVLACVFWSLLLGIAVGLRYAVKQVAPWGWALSGVCMAVGCYDFIRSMPRMRAMMPLLEGLGRRCHPRTWAPRPPRREDQSAERVPRLAGEPINGDPSGGPDDVGRTPNAGSTHPFTVPGLFLLCLLVPMLAMARYFAHGLTDYGGSIMPDGWSYVAVGQYLWEHTRGANLGLAPLYEYGSIYASTRYLSYSLLGFLSPLTRAGDTQSTSALLQAWAIYNLSSAVGLFWLAERRKAWTVAVAILLSATGAWTLNALWAGNYDQLLATIYVPAFAGILILFDSRQWQWWLVLGAMFAGALYTYPELAPAIMGATFVLALPRFWRERRQWPVWFGGCAFMALVTLAAASPFLREEVDFFLAQFASASQAGSRPGEGFLAGLTIRSFEPAAFWGLGGEFRMRSHLMERNLAGFLLSLLAAIGLVHLVMRRRWHLAVIALLFGLGALYYIVRYDYAYGAYKFPSIGWWAFVVALVTGIEYLTNRVGRVPGRPITFGVVALTALVIASQGGNFYKPENRYQIISSRYRAFSASQFHRVEEIDRIIGDQPVMVFVDDWLANEWAVYYLRDRPISVGAYRMYMATPNNVATMQRAPMIRPDDIHYVLTDTSFDEGAAQWQIVWSGGPYRLWRSGDANWATITHITDIRGIEQSADERTLFWMTQDPVKVQVQSLREAHVLLRGEFAPGPSLPDVATRKVSVITDRGFQQVVSLRPGIQEIPVPVGMGETTITLKDVDTPTLRALPSGDPRILLLAVSGLSVSADTGRHDYLAEPIRDPSDFTFDATFTAHPSSVAEPLVTAGRTGAGDFVYVHYLDDGKVAFVWEHWGRQRMEGAPVEIEWGRPYRLHVVMSRAAGIVTVSLDEAEVLRVASDIYPASADQVAIGENHIGGTGPGPRFSGVVAVVSIR